MSDSDRPSRVPAGAAPTPTTPTTPAGTVLGAAAASSVEYSAATAQGAATALVGLLMEQMVLGPDCIASKDRLEAPGTGTWGPDSGPVRPGGVPDEPCPAREPGERHEKERRG
ncbi:hypothetical protein [Streptomyces sp. SM11]|uniref:hypothetical protein n=1 Tax=Streptomyces sp. SM11 TaxID=565557 RepID=UPI000CD59A4E|nr:hypothetical protein [Streptomyces sp. SM11]